MRSRWKGGDGRITTSNIRLFSCTLTVTWACFLLFSHPAGASGEAQTRPKDIAEMTLEELMHIEVKTVFSASRYAQKVTEAPSSISIITAEEIKSYGYRHLADILRSVRGFYVTYDRNYHYLGVRGFSRPGDFNTRVLLLINGVRVNDNIYDQAAIGTDFPLDIDLIERVEIVRGPSSSLYGTNAFMAAVNVITHQGGDLAGTEMSGEYGTFDTYKARLTAGKRLQSDWNFLLSGTWQESDGDERLSFPEFNDPPTSNGVAEGLDDDRAASVFALVSWRDLTLQAVYSEREKAVPTAAYEMIFNDARAKTIDEHYSLDLKYEHLFPGQLGVLARGSYNGYYYRGDYPTDRNGDTPAAEPQPVLNRDRSRGRWWGVEAQATKTVWDKHQLTLGGELRRDTERFQENFDVAPFTSYLRSNRSGSFWAVYLQDEFRLRPQLRVSAGARYDHYQTFGGTLNPRFALIYTPSDQTAFKLIYGEAFRAPNAYELYYHDGGLFQKGNSGLTPEEIRTWEFVYEQYLGRHLRTSASVFYYRIDDLIILQADPVDDLQQFRNSGRADGHGAEFEIEGKLHGGFQGRASYAWVRAEDERTGRRLTNSPAHLAKLNVTAPLWREALLGGIEVQYTGERKTLRGGRDDDFFLTNLTLLARQVLPGLELSASVYNLFDRKYEDPGSNEHVQDGIAQDGRTYRMKATYRF